MAKRIEDIRLDHGAKFPYGSYHATGEAVTIEDWAHFAALGVMSDLCDRGGIKHMLHDIEVDDAKIAQGIVDSLAAIIRRAHERMPPATSPGGEEVG